ncbi:MAG TPA: ABC transporter ATP-binding protein [Candidatus Micrarchaeia archaeon]|nr:ABC transporter ATP-binding protein [Candidatus Micrarchaeia archaeon]
MSVPAPPAGAAPPGPALQVEQLTKHFGGVNAVTDCSFAAPRHRVTGLIGPNGAGKSTAIDCISGFKRPDAGMVLFGDRAITGLPPHRIARLGLVRTFQTPREWPQLTVMENLILSRYQPRREGLWRGMLRGGHVADQAELAQVREVLDQFGLLGLRNERAGNLSGGQKRLVEFARIRIAEPELVILDEPMGGVNPVLGERMAAAIETLVAHGAAVVLVEHNLPFIERVTQHVVVMAHGAVIAAGPFEAIRSDRAVIDAYLGTQRTDDA